jgi:ubiquinone biosynthesis protein
LSTIGAYFRLLRAGWIMVREGVVAAMPGDQLDGLPHAAWRLARVLARRRSRGRDRTERIGRAVERLGPSYVKLGQFLATRPDVVGADLAMDLARLQDRMETFPTTDAVAAIEGSLGRPWETSSWNSASRSPPHRLRRCIPLWSNATESEPRWR